MAQKLGKYEIIEELGRGAMGVVYKARDPFIGRLVALKTITGGLQDQPELLQRFYREAQAAGGLQHPNIVTIFDLGEGDGTPYIAMEFLEGEDLEKIISEQRPLPLSQKIGYMAQAARALDYAHKRGVVHRDIKPANIVVTKDGTIKVVDFGIARLVDTSRSQTGLLIGTVNYMSPEQVRGERVDGRSDIFSLGVMFYELVSYQRPFIGNNFTAVMLAIISQEPRKLREVAPDCPAELEEVIHKVLRKDISERYQQLDEMLIDLDPVWKRLQHETVADMVAQSEKLVQQKDLAKARDILRQAVLIDTSHKHAKTMLERVNNELKRTLVLPQAQEHVQKGEALLKEGKLAEATAEAEAALKLDSVYAPAQELQKKVQEEMSRAQLVKEYLRTTKQRLAEGSLTEAEQSLSKLLEIETGKEAKELKKQLDEEKTRREKRKRLLDTMQQARGLWTQQQYEECVKLLTTLQKEFPNEAEVSKLLETVREDQAEQTKQQKLGEAKSLLGAQRFADALDVLQPLVERYKDDTVVQRLHDHIQAERKIHAQRVRLEREQGVLKKLVAEEKYAEALSKGELLLKEFPDEIELARLVDFARSQQAQIEHQRKLKELSNEVLRHMDKQNWEAAIKAADKALDSFPGNSEIRQMLEEARDKQKEKEKKEYVEKQIRSIKALMEKENQTEAIDLARQTLAVVKHHTEIAGLLQLAERDRDMRDQKKQQEDQLKTVAILLKKEKFDEAKKILKDVEKTQIFDPRVHELMKAAQEKRAPSPEIVDKPLPEGTVAQQYVFAPGRPSAPEPEVAGPVASASPVPVAPTPAPPPMAVPIPPAPVKEPVKEVKPAAPPAKPPVEEPPKKAKPIVEEPPAKKEEKKGKPVVEEPKKKEEEKKAKPVVEEPKKAAPAVVEPPAKKPEAKPVVAPVPPAVKEPPAKPRVEERPAPKPLPRVEPVPPVAEKKSPVMMIGIAAVLVIAIGFGVWKFMGSGSPGGGGGTGSGSAEEQQLSEAAGKLQGEGKWDEALNKYQELSGKGGAMKGDADTKIADLQKLIGEEKSLFDAGRTALKQKKYADAETRFGQVVAMNGPLKARANEALGGVRELASGKKPEQIEKEKFDRANDAIKKGDWPRAQGLLQEVVGMGLANAPRAQSLTKTVDDRVREEMLFQEGMDLQAAGNKDGAKTKFTDVIAMNGPKKGDAQTQIKIIEGALNEEKARQELMDRAKSLVSQGNYRDARALFPQIRSMKGDPSGIESDITQGEQRAYNDLMGKFNQAKSSENESELRDLQAQARSMGAGGGSQASNASNLEREIGNALNEISNRRAAALVAKEKEAFDTAVSNFSTAVTNKDASALNGAVKRAFQAIATGSGKYVPEANDYLTNKIPSAVIAARPCPPSFPAIAASGMTVKPKPGDPVAATLLDTRPAWTACPFPTASGTAPAMMSVTVDENGNVLDVKPRGVPADQAFFNAAAAAVKNWKASPAPKSMGVGVRVNVSVDIKP